MSVHLLLFALVDEVTKAAADAGIDALVVDLERRGKRARQTGFDTHLSTATIADVERVRALSPLPLIVRVDGPGAGLQRRVRQAVDAGADEVLIPMVSDAAEVAGCLQRIPAGVPVGVLVERTTAIDDVEAIGRLPLRRVYLGLMDLMVERGTSTPFAALADGTLERVRRAVPGPVGVAGLTRPGCGAPVPVELLAAELMRVGVDFTFLRRSFLGAVRSPGDVADAVSAMRTMLGRMRRRTAAEVRNDRALLLAAIAELESP